MKKIPEWQERTSVLLGEDKTKSLAEKHVLLIGAGGVGGSAAEMLTRAGIGELTLIDADIVAPSNINRQFAALHSTIGQPKVNALANRLTDINPCIQLHLVRDFVTPETVAEILSAAAFDFVIDAIDTIAPKVATLTYALKHKLPVISSMGAGAKTDISKIHLANIWKTYHCGLAKAVRKGLTKEGLKGAKLPVVFCAESADKNAVIKAQGERNKKTTCGTISYMPAAFGCFLTSYVLRKLVLL